MAIRNLQIAKGLLLASSEINLMGHNIYFG